MENGESVDEHSTADKMEMLNLYEDVTLTCKKFRGLLEKCQYLLSSFDAQRGVSLFNVKSDAMLTYVCNILYLILKKCCGLSIRDPQTRERIGQVRVILEKIKPLELKLKYQIEKYMKITHSEQSDSAVDKSSFRARIENLQDDESNQIKNGSDDDDNDESEEEEAVQDEENDDLGIGKTKKPSITHKVASNTVYKPPKLAAVPYDDSREEEKRQRRLEQSKKRALSTSIIQELKEEYLDTPLEVTNSTTLRNKRTNYRQEKESYEETYFTRLPTTKKERHMDKQMSSLTLGSLGAKVTQFEDISALDERAPHSSNKRKKSTFKKNKSFKKRRTR